MKKIDLLKLIEYSKIINKNKKILSIIKYKDNSKTILNKEYWFPNIKDLEEEFKILSSEIEETIEETSKYETYIKNNCNHEIRLEHYGLFCSDYECIFCSQNVVGDNCVNWEYSINRNKHTVSFVAKHQLDDDYGYISKGYTKEDIYEIILNNIKDKEEEEEIDLIQEFKKLNLNNCKINEERKVNENYILIIDGSNKHYIDKETYIFKPGINIGIDFLKYFTSLLNTKVELIDNILLEDKEIKDNKYIKQTKYNTIEELQKLLSNQQEIPFKLIIDITELYEYKIENNTITKEPYNINLEKYFPNSHIIKIKNLTTKTLEELSKYLKQTTNTYAYQKDIYYHEENNEIKKETLENTCSKLKLLLKK